ncbi:hypothetical protein GEMRC1_006913 [Eukaryota sp. GEM-RC1]
MPSPPPTINPPEGHYIINEGSAAVIASNSVFFNKVQTFNRDITLLAIHAFNNMRVKQWKRDVPPRKLRILEALSATGLRAIRFAKELPSESLGEVIANDISPAACEQILQSIGSQQLILIGYLHLF